MPRDYAKRQTRKKYKRKATKSHWKLWLFSLSLLIAFAISLIFLNKTHNIKTATKKIIPLQAITTAQKPVASEINKPQFDFYTILPKEKVNIPETSTENKTQYFLQIATFKNYTAADQLRAKLALLGFDVYIDKIKSKGDTVLNRINVGPYFSYKTAKQDQQRLKENNISGMLRKEEKAPFSQE
jgi:cell division protein FtsN